VAVTQDDRVTIGKIERPFGLKGEVKVRSLSDVPGRFDHLDAVGVMGPTGQMSDKTVTHVRRAGETYIMRFAGVTTPEEAGTLRGGLIQIPRTKRPAQSNDLFYECDLVGMRVEDEKGHELGVVDTVWDMPGHHIFVVRKGDRELLIPAAKNFVKAVDVPQRRMVVQIIEGMVEDPDAL
jgi:16S rRNA processing protein RimM